MYLKVWFSLFNSITQTWTEVGVHNLGLIDKRLNSILSYNHRLGTASDSLLNIGKKKKIGQMSVFSGWLRCVTNFPSFSESLKK